MTEPIPPVRIRVAGSGDVAAMTSVVNRAFAVETFFEGPRTDAALMAEMMGTGAFLVAEDAQARILGCVHVEQRGTRGYFGMLSVDPACQAMRLGRRLIDAAEDYFRTRGISGVDITVLSLRTELIPFYEKLGYRKTRTEPFHSAQPLKPGLACDSIVMSKEI